MSSSVRVRFEAGGLVLAEEADGSYSFPAGDGPGVVLLLERALHARIRPVGTAETVLHAWAEGGPPQATVAWDDPAAVPPVRVRAGAVVIRDGRMLLIGFEDDGRAYYEMPGGGVEEGESLHRAAVRELREETGLHGRVVRELARVWKDGRREHYFLLDADGEVGPGETLDNDGGRPTWVPVADLPHTPVWPRRLAWRIAHWHAHGWPGHPAELADGILDLDAPCSW